MKGEMFDVHVTPNSKKFAVIIEQNKIWVGFSRLRPTPFQEHINWLKGKLGLKDWRNLPTRILEYDLFNKKLLEEFNLENFGLHTIFSIHLINNEDKSFLEAKGIAETEILTIFSISDSTGTGFENMV